MTLKNKNDSPVTLRIIFNLITPFDRSVSDVIYNYLNINFNTQMIMIL